MAEMHAARMEGSARQNERAGIVCYCNTTSEAN